MNKPKSLQFIALVAKSHLDRSGLSVLRKINIFLKKKGCAVLYDKNAATHLAQKAEKLNSILENADMVITIGGDGTLIKLAPHMPSDPVPILSINLGTVGLLTEVQNPERSIEILKNIFKNRYHIDERTMLRATIYRKGEKYDTFLALNEVVINQGNFARLIELSAEVNQRKMVQLKADGVIISTATGSTGHSLSAGGPIVHPKVDALIFTPICPAALSIRPIVIPSNRQLTISIETERRFKDNYIALTIDGQKTVPLEYGDRVKIRQSYRTFNLVRLSNTRYYRVLRDRLNWGD